MSPQLFYGIQVICFAVYTATIYFFSVSWTCRLILIGASTTSFITWFLYDSWKKREKEENYLYDLFLISPVNNISEEDFVGTKDYVDRLEADGYKVYWPLRDTNQKDDPIGTRICTDNSDAMLQSREVHIWYSKTSKGSIFDLGMVYPTSKRIIIANPQSIIPTEDKSFENILLELHAVAEEERLELEEENAELRRRRATDVLRYD